MADRKERQAMKRRGGPSDRIERKQTAAADQITGQFHCSSSNHFATGTPVIVRGRKVCRACAAQRKKIMKEKARG